MTTTNTPIPTVYLVAIPRQWPPDRRRHALREHPEDYLGVCGQITALCGKPVVVPFPVLTSTRTPPETTPTCDRCQALAEEHGYRCLHLDSG
ncbi:hypothetical protein [Actinopolyspora mortivallis]|uniref:hypothetical protein n=1 Tax=Actinopolyspora mortivallis TaxID=33906 RepID=UPI0015E6017C|nr:hypothetical protein [Actinopolyspora mortivallis]